MNVRIKWNLKIFKVKIIKIPSKAIKRVHLVRQIIFLIVICFWLLVLVAVIFTKPWENGWSFMAIAIAYFSYIIGMPLRGYLSTRCKFLWLNDNIEYISYNLGELLSMFLGAIISIILACREVLLFGGGEYAIIISAIQGLTTSITLYEIILKISKSIGRKVLM